MVFLFKIFLDTRFIKFTNISPTPKQLTKYSKFMCFEKKRFRCRNGKGKYGKISEKKIKIETKSIQTLFLQIVFKKNIHLLYTEKIKCL